jgi:DnaJ-class molecular chaperone
MTWIDEIISYKELKMEKRIKTPWQWIDLEEKIQDEGYDPCPVCHGTKQDVLIGRITCPDCRGKKMKWNQNGSYSKCNRCDKNGTIFDPIWVECSSCKGSGIRTWIDKMIRPFLFSNETKDK